MSFCILLRKYLFYFNYRFHVPVVMYVLLSLHNLLLVVNSSVNFIIYCCVGKRFRQELKLMLTPYCNFVCRCVCNDQKDQADAEDPVPCQFWSLLNEIWNICIPLLHIIGKFQKYIPMLMSILSSIVAWENESLRFQKVAMYQPWITHISFRFPFSMKIQSCAKKYRKIGLYEVKWP